MEAIEEYEHAGLTIKIVGDDEGGFESPLDYDGRLGQFSVEYRGYDLGGDDNIEPSELFDADCMQCDGTGELDTEPGLPLAETEPTRQCPHCRGRCKEDPIKFIQREHGAKVILPLFVYEHSGITIRAGGRLDKGEDDLASNGRFMGDGAGWDTSTVGVIFDTAERRKECGVEDWTDEQIEESLQAEVQAYAWHLEGYYTGYVVEDADGDILESCFGFLGPDDQSGIKEEAKHAAEACAAEIAREKERVHEAACRDIVTVGGKAS